VGRSVAALLVMLVTFAALAALFVALDGAAGVHPQPPLFAAAARRHAVEHPAVGKTATPARGIIFAPSGTPARMDAETRTAIAIIEARVNGGGSVTSVPSVATGAVSPVVIPMATPADAATGTAPATGTVAPTPTVTSPPDTATPAGVLTTTTVTVMPTGILTATGTVTATGDTPPHYGALLTYTNNTQFTPAFMQTLDEQIIALTNAQRATHNLAPLREDGQLDIIAASRSQDQIKRNYFDHYDPTGPVDANGRHAAAVVELLARNNVPYTEVGENLINHIGLALDASTPRELVDSWMRHREHRDNILHGGYATIGVGMAAENESDGLHVVFTQVFVR